MVKIWISGNYLYIDDNGVLRNCHVSNAEFNKNYATPNNYTIVTNDGTVTFKLSDVIDENDAPFASESAFETWYETNTGINTSDPLPVTLGSENITITGSVNVGSTVEITNDLGNPIPTSAASLPLPTGASTSALQTALVNSQTITQITNQSVAIGATSVQSNAVNASTGRVILMATADCWVSFGSNPTAVAHTNGSGFFLAAGASTYPISVTAGTTKIAVIQDSGSGYLSINEIV